MPEISIETLRERLNERLPEKCKELKPHFDGVPVLSLRKGSFLPLTAPHHMIYIATLESGRKVVVRVMNPTIRIYAGEKSPFKMTSEIATMKYVRKHTKVPVPEVLAYDPDKDGKVGGEWMVMERVHGVAAILMWPALSKELRRKLTLAMANVFAQLLKQRFSKIGSLYEEGEDSFVVGPMALIPSHDKIDRSVPDDEKCGPFGSQKDWLLAVAKGDLDVGRDRPLQGEDLERMKEVIKEIEEADLLDDAADHSKIALEHVDLNLTNVFVNPDFPTEITGVIDWEGARTAPMWAIQPRFFERTWKMYEVEKQELHAFGYELIRLRVSAWNAGGREPGWELRNLLREAQERRVNPSKVEDAVASLARLSLQVDEERLRREAFRRSETPEPEDRRY